MTAFIPSISQRSVSWAKVGTAFVFPLSVRNYPAGLISFAYHNVSASAAQRHMNCSISLIGTGANRDRLTAPGEAMPRRWNTEAGKLRPNRKESLAAADGSSRPTDCGDRTRMKILLSRNLFARTADYLGCGIVFVLCPLSFVLCRSSAPPAWRQYSARCARDRSDDRLLLI